VTLSIGGNDLLLLQQKCATDLPDFAACVTKNLPTTLATYGSHLADILTTIRAAYHGPLIIMKSYAPNADPLFVSVIVALNQVMVAVGTPFGAKFADGFTAFELASWWTRGDPCKAGLLIPLGNGVCDVHPSPAGRFVLALAVLAVH
jgi:hypothetical protein